MDTKIDTSTQESITIRIVFDGAPYAGKTTAAYSLSEALGEVAVTPAEEAGGRTAWFDWVTYTGGRHEGKAIRVELVTVPGQDHLNDRRRHLLQWADVVVFVADTAASAIAASVAKFDELRRDLNELGEVPVVVIANKRDVDDAIPLEDVQSELKLQEDESLIEGVATTGGGIRQAFIFAVRAALKQTTDRVEQTTANELLQEMVASLFPQPGAANPQTAAAVEASPQTEPAVYETSETPRDIDGDATPEPSTIPTAADTPTEPEPSAEPSATNPTAADEATEPEPSTEPTTIPTAADTPTDVSPGSASRNGLRLIGGAVPDGTSVVLYPIHWDVLAAVANNVPLLTTGDSPEVHATNALIEWGLMIRDSEPNTGDPSDGHELDNHEPEAKAAQTSVLAKTPRDGSAARQARAVALAAENGSSVNQAAPLTTENGSLVNQAAPLTTENGSLVDEVVEPDVSNMTPMSTDRAVLESTGLQHPYAHAGTSPALVTTVEHRNDRYKALRELRRSLRT